MGIHPKTSGYQNRAAIVLFLQLMYDFSGDINLDML
jgi:hypothetical protein